MFFRRKKCQKALYVPKMLYLCTVKQKNDNRSLILGYGVMVTQQILVLFFLVRIRVAQQNRRRFRFILKRLFYFYLCVYPQFYWNEILIL